MSSDELKEHSTPNYTQLNSLVHALFSTHTFVTLSAAVCSAIQQGKLIAWQDTEVNAQLNLSYADIYPKLISWTFPPGMSTHHCISLEHRESVNADAGDGLSFVSGPYATSDIFDHAALIDRLEHWVVSVAQHWAGSTARMTEPD